MLLAMPRRLSLALFPVVLFAIAAPVADGADSTGAPGVDARDPASAGRAPRPLSELPSDRILTFTIYLGGGYTRSMAPLIRKFDYVIVNKNTLDAGMADDVSPDVPVVMHEGLQIRPNFCHGRCEHEDWLTIDAHEDWFWHDERGRRVQTKGQELWHMDYRNPEYLEYLCGRFRRLLDRYPALDGIFLDQNGFYEGFTRYGVPSMEPAPIFPLPTKREYEAANVDALRVIKSALPSSQVIINSNNEPLFNSVVDGSMAEGFVHPGGKADDAFRPESDWRREIETLADASNAGKAVFLFTKAKGEDPEAARRILRYALASYLIGRRADSKALFGFESRAEMLPPYYEEYETITGEPRGEPKRDSSGVWVREYEDGIAVVHADNTRGSATLTLSGPLAGTYRGWDGACHTGSVTLAPNTGDFLKRADCR
jgi:Hypothetical glycosyl hydrolase family 15